MEQLINRVLGAGGTRADLEVKIFGGGRVLPKLSDVGARNLDFVREFLQAGRTEDRLPRTRATRARGTCSISRAPAACAYVT